MCHYLQITTLCYSLSSKLIKKAPKPECEAVCEEPRCDWQCTKPECPKPKCELVCENPNCKPKVACCGCDGAALGQTPIFFFKETEKNPTCCSCNH